MSTAERLQEDKPADAEVEVAVEAKPDNTKAKAKKPSVKGPDPISRFSGDGVVFRAKLFGTADVREPRGDSVCATAMNLLKAAVKNTGEHKQKILLKITLNGIIIVEALTQTKLYEHPVNKISFIAKDPTDNRAFGYIIGEKDGAHLYFGIKTERAAEQVVLTLKDLFQTVFDMKKKEAELKGKDSTETQSTATTQPPASAEATTSTAPAATTDTQVSSTTQPAADVQKSSEEPSLGDEVDSAAVKPDIKRDDSQSHLLDLLDNLSFATPAPTPSVQQTAQFGQQSNTAVWGNSVNPTIAPGWGNSAPVQNDPFATSTTAVFPNQPSMQQASPFAQQPNQAPFQLNFNQPSFNQPNPMVSGYQPQGVNQPQQLAQPVTNAPFQTQPNPFTVQSSAPVNSVFSPAQAPVTASPFGANPTSDPFNPTGFQTTTQPQQPSASNPFASSGSQFGVLQPQQVPQPTAANASALQSGAPTNLFSDLNPLPNTNNNVRKDQFFSDVKNPPKPKLNEMQPAQPNAEQPVSTNEGGLLW